MNRGQALDLESINLCVGVVQSLEQALMQFDFRNSDLRRKFDSIKYVVKKLETLAYEVDLARKRASLLPSQEAEHADVAASVEVTEPPPKRPRISVELVDPSLETALDLNLLGDIKQRYDRFDAMREQTIKRSRDVMKSAKNAIFALQREDFRKADSMLNQSAQDAGGIYRDLVANAPALRGGSFAAALEELCEAWLYRAFRQERRLLGLAELQETSKLAFKLTLPEYFGGLMDLTGEVGRLAVRSASATAAREIELCLACVDSVYMGIQELPYLPGNLGKKMGPLKGTLTKIEGILYELALLSQGGMAVKAPAPTAAGEVEDADTGATGRGAVERSA